MKRFDFDALNKDCFDFDALIRIALILMLY